MNFRSVRAGAAEAEIVLGGDDRDRVARDHVEQRERHHEEEGRGGEALDRQEFNQRDDEGQHRQRVIDDLARGRPRRLDDLDEEQNERDQEEEIGEREEPLVAGDDGDIHAVSQEEGFEIVVAYGPAAESHEIINDDNNRNKRKQAKHAVLPWVPPVTISLLYHNWVKLRRC